MKVRDAMTAPAITIGPDAPYRAIVHSLLTHDISGLPVVDLQDRLLGIVTEADLIAADAYGHSRRRVLGLVGDVVAGQQIEWIVAASEMTAAELMTPETVVADLDDDLASIARLMLETPCKRLPVVRDGRVVGIISRHDLLRRFDRADRELSLDISNLLADPAQITGAGAVKATVSNGVVTLTGTMTDIDAEQSMEDAIIEIDGVADLDDRVVVRTDSA